jgi:hypothetical protein
MHPVAAAGRAPAEKPRGKRKHRDKPQPMRGPPSGIQMMHAGRACRSAYRRPGTNQSLILVRPQTLDVVFLFQGTGTLSEAVAAVRGVTLPSPDLIGW